MRFDSVNKQIDGFYCIDGVQIDGEYAACRWDGNPLLKCRAEYRNGQWTKWSEWSVESQSLPFVFFNAKPFKRSMHHA